MEPAHAPDGPVGDPRDDDPGLARIGCAALGAAALGLPAVTAAIDLCHFLIGLQIKGLLPPIELLPSGCMRTWWWLYGVPALVGLGLGLGGYIVVARMGQAAVKRAMWAGLIWVAAFSLIVALTWRATLAGK